MPSDSKVDPIKDQRYYQLLGCAIDRYQTYVFKTIFNIFSIGLQTMHRRLSRNFDML